MSSCKPSSCIQSVQDLCSAWPILLFHPMMWPSLQQPNDEASWQCHKVVGPSRDTDRHNVASLSFDFGGCGLQSAWRTRVRE